MDVLFLIKSLINGVIREQAERGPFEMLVAGAFVTVAVDNINMRAGHSLSVHRQTYHGFDGLAVQGVNSDVNFDFYSFLQSLPEIDRLPRYPVYNSLIEYMEQRFPDATKIRT